jgi:hypothetical protein
MSDVSLLGNGAGGWTDSDSELHTELTDDAS